MSKYIDEIQGRDDHIDTLEATNAEQAKRIEELRVALKGCRLEELAIGWCLPLGGSNYIQVANAPWKRFKNYNARINAALGEET